MGNAQQYIGRRVEVDRYNVEVVKYIGEGGSSFIFLVKDVHSASARPMILKRLVAAGDAAYEWIKSEVAMHRGLRHPQIVEFYAVKTIEKPRSEREVFILMEYCPGGHLFENMAKMGTKRYTERELLRVFRQLCVPVSVLHHSAPPIAHRDLKLENFLLAQSGVYKLCDFGSCVIGPQRLASKQDRARENEHVLKRTTAMYRSPELADVDGTALFGAGELTEAVDIWAMGCVLYSMAFFKPPFAPEGLRTERYTIPKDSTYSQGLHQLIARMLQADVTQRASIDLVLASIDALLDGQAMPSSVPAAATTDRSVSASVPPRANPSHDKQVEARKESVAPAKPAAAARDLLDMDCPPVIPTTTTAKANVSNAKLVSCDAPPGISADWTTTAPTEGFADFAQFEATPVATQQGPPPKQVSVANDAFDAFSFAPPAAPVNQPVHHPPAQTHAAPMSGGLAGFGSGGMNPMATAKVDPFEGLSGQVGQQSHPSYSSPGVNYPGMASQPRPQLYQTQQQQPPQQQQQQQFMWNQQQQQQQHQQQAWGGNYPRGF